MANISRVRVAMTGFIGAPGVMTFYCLTPDTFVTALHAWLVGVAGSLPGVVKLNIEPGGDTIDSTSGALTGSWAGAATAEISGADTGGYSAPSGMVISWLTGTVVDGHRLRGKTYLVPFARSAYGPDGQLNAANVADMKTKADAFQAAAAANFVIWHRNRKARAADATHLAVTARAGGHSIVSGTRVTGRPAVLTSRRD